MGIKPLVATLCAAVALLGANAHASTLLYSASGVVGTSTGGSVDELSVDVGFSQGYPQPSVIDPLSSTFRGSNLGPTETLYAVLTTNATFYNETSYLVTGHNAEYFASGAAGLPGIMGYALLNYGDIYGNIDITPTQYGDANVWQVTDQFVQIINGCSPDGWMTDPYCTITDHLYIPTELDFDIYFASGEGDPYTLQIYAGGIPEPAEWALAVLGLALVGSALRGHRNLALRTA